MVRNLFFPLLTLILPGLLIGCGASSGSAVTLTPVSGTITVAGQPLPNAYVLFSPYGDVARSAYGTTDAAGKYELRSMDGGSGCPAGKFLVTVSKFAQPDGSPFPEGMPPEEASVVGVEHILPRYSDPQQTKLAVEIPASGGTFDFEVEMKKK